MFCRILRAAVRPLNDVGILGRAGTHDLGRLAAHAVRDGQVLSTAPRLTLVLRCT